MLQNTSIAGFAFALQLALELPQVTVAAEPLFIFSPSENLEIHVSSFLIFWFNELGRCVSLLFLLY